MRRQNGIDLFSQLRTSTRGQIEKENKDCVDLSLRVATSIPRDLYNNMQALAYIGVQIYLRTFTSLSSENLNVNKVE